MKLTIKDITIEVLEGDLVEIQADAYVCPVNVKLTLAYGIASILKKYAGEEFGDELRSKKSPELGTVITVRGGNLLAKYVFCAVMEDEMHDVPRELVPKVLQHCFRLTHAMGLKKIAIPMLGSPRAKIPYDTFSQLIIRATFEYFAGQEYEGTDQLNIVFVLYNNELFKSFCDQLAILRQEFFL